MISEARDSIESALIMSGIDKVYKFLPERPIPPCAIIEPDDDFINVYDDQYVADYSSNWRVNIMVQTGTNKLETTNLDNLIDTCLPTLWNETTASTISVDKPFLQEVNGAVYLSTNINISIDMQGGN